jgi:hypothetical protein
VFDSVVDNAAHVAGVPALWRRRTAMAALLLAFAAAVAAATATWLQVAHTISRPEPVVIPKRPPVSAVVWSNRVFVDLGMLERWLAARGTPYAAWARRHPHAVAVLGGRQGSHR